MIGPVELTVLAILAAVPVAVHIHGLRSHPGQVDRRAKSAGLALTPDSREALRRYLVWSRGWRTAGALVGFLLPIGYSMLTDRQFFIDNGLVLILTGYLLGAIVAEIVLNRSGQRAGAALLVPRRLEDYLPGYVIVLQRGLAAISAALVGVYAISPFPNFDIPQPDLRTYALYGAAGVGVWIVIESLQRLIVSRRQPAVAADLLAVNDAIRSLSVHSLAGAGVGLLLIVVGTQVSVFTALDGMTGWTLALLSALLYFSALFFWLDLTKPHGHRVERSRSQSVT